MAYRKANDSMSVWVGKTTCSPLLGSTEDRCH